MKLRKIAALSLALILAFLMAPAAAFAEAPAETVEEFTITGYYAYNLSTGVVSVKVNGVDLDESTVSAVPGSTVTVEIVLENGYEVWQNSETGEYLWWEFMTDEGWMDYDAGTSLTSAIVPSEDLLETTNEIELDFAVIPKYTAINSVTLTAPSIAEGEGYAYGEVQEENSVYYDYLPIPEVTAPADAPYDVVLAGWAVPSDDPEDMWGLGFDEPEEDVTFEKDQYYYIYAYVLATDFLEVDDPEVRRVDKTQSTKALGPDGFRVFSVDNPPQVTIKNGEYVDSVVIYETPRAVAGDISAELLVIMKVKIQDNTMPPTSDMNPAPWVWAMVLAISLAITAIYYEIADIRRAYRR